jgi:hypothetical protein
MPLRLVAIALVIVGCVSTPRARLATAQRMLAAGEAVRARDAYDAIAADTRVGDDERLAALLGAAHACDRLNDPPAARARLERAVERDVPGKVEAAEFELAERLRDEDRGRALALYYRAAAGAEKHLGGAFPYRAAMDRIVQLSMTR